MKKLLTFALLSLLTSNMMAKDIQTVVYTPTPKMVCEKCEKKIKDTLRLIKGTKKIETSLKKQTITITYDADMVATDAYVSALGKIKRDVKEVVVADKPIEKPAKK